MRTLVAAAAVVIGMQPSVRAQWIDHPDPRTPRLANGKPNLTAPVPRSASGRPDLSGSGSASPPRSATTRPTTTCSTGCRMGRRSSCWPRRWRSIGTAATCCRERAGHPSAACRIVFLTGCCPASRSSSSRRPGSCCFSQNSWRLLHARCLPTDAATQPICNPRTPAMRWGNGMAMRFVIESTGFNDHELAR